MKKLKYLVSIVLSLAMLAGVGAVTGCHKHTYDMNVWESVDDTYHWHPVSCGHKDQEGIDKTEHNYDSDFKCRDCGYRHEHTFSEEWTAQGKEGHYHASACGHDVKSALEPHDFDENLTCKLCNYVLEEAGIEVTKTTVEYKLDISKPKVKIDLSDLQVYQIMENGERGKQLTADDYEVAIYNGTTPVDTRVKVAAGDYNVWVKVKNKPELESFVLVHVLDDLAGLELISSEGTFQQKRHRRDLISDTWQFTATYVSGNTKTVTVDDGVVIKDFKTNEEGTGMAMAVYTETNYKKEATSQQTGVPYTILHTDFVASYQDVTGDLFGSATINTDSDTILKEWDGGKITATATIDKGMATGNGGGYNDPTGNLANNRTFAQCLDVGGEGNNQARSVKVELNEIAANEIATIIIYVRSRATDSKWIGLYDHTFVDKDSTPDAQIGEYVEAPSKSVSIAKYEFDLTAADIEEGGTFYIASSSGAFYFFGLEVVYCET